MTNAGKVGAVLAVGAARVVSYFVALGMGFDEIKAIFAGPIFLAGFAIYGVFAFLAGALLGGVGTSMDVLR